MKRIALLLPLVLGFAAGPAAAQDVNYNFDQDTDFSKFKSYKWVDIKSVQQVDYATTRQITFVIDAELANKGLLKTDSDHADLYIGYQTALSRQTAWMAYRDGCTGHRHSSRRPHARAARFRAASRRYTQTRVR